LKHITDGSFIKLEPKIKALLETDHVIHDAIKKLTKVLVNKNQFYKNRKNLRMNLANWNKELDPDDIRECNTLTEVAHIAQDSLSGIADNFFSTSITIIMALEFSKIHVPAVKSTKISEPTFDTHQYNQQSTEKTCISTEDEIHSVKRQVEEYTLESNKKIQKINQMQNVLQMVFRRFTEQEVPNNTIQKIAKHWRQLYSQP
jgi:hypothetical protein